MKKIKKCFTDEERNIIKEAIEDHRFSSDYMPRSIYGMIVSTADKTILDIAYTITRCYSYVVRHFLNFQKMTN